MYPSNTKGYSSYLRLMMPKILDPFSPLFYRVITHLLSRLMKRVPMGFYFSDACKFRNLDKCSNYQFGSGLKVNMSGSVVLGLNCVIRKIQSFFD